MNRAAYSGPIALFLDASDDDTLGKLVNASDFAVELSQRDAWRKQILLLKQVLVPYRGRGSVYFEWSIPRLGKRIDTLVIIDSVLFVIEFKVGETQFTGHALDQVCDYALDLKNFHETSHEAWIAPVLVATEADAPCVAVTFSADEDRLLDPVATNAAHLSVTMDNILAFTDAEPLSIEAWERGRYQPTPTIVEAATALYRGHNVEEISRSDAGAINLTKTTHAVAEIIKHARDSSQKAIVFVTGVPGAGKTLVGLKIATQHMDSDAELYSVFLSGNGPLVAILREALALDTVQQAADRGEKITKSEARSQVKAFIQNVHHFRDDCLVDRDSPPIEHVALFDEAQRAWNHEQTAGFMKQKKGVLDFDQSEPAFLISCMDRHQTWAVVVCLVGGGQEINKGEAGISEWVDAARERFPSWHLHLSPRLTDVEYQAGDPLRRVKHLPTTHLNEDLHLGVSMRSYRAERVSELIKQTLDIEPAAAKDTYISLRKRYPVMLTRSLDAAKEWLREKARGSERYGIVVSSQAERLKPHAIDVRPNINPVHWFLHGKDDVRSSYYLEDVATEFLVQGLELDWACVTWDADLRMVDDYWQHWSFKGSKWQRILKEERRSYQKNAYRVLMTRARQGMVIVVPEGDPEDQTRLPSFYDKTYEYLKAIGFDELNHAVDPRFSPAADK